MTMAERTTVNGPSTMSKRTTMNRRRRATIKTLLLGCVLSGVALAAEAQDSAAIEHGKAVYTYWCHTCHGPGDEYPGTVALTVKYRGAIPGVLEDRTDLAPDLIRTMVRNGVSVMPFFRKTEISDADLDAIVAYLTAKD